MIRPSSGASSRSARSRSCSSASKQTSISLATEALEHARAADDPRGIAAALNSLALAEMTVGERDSAEAHLRESEAISTEHGDLRNALIAGGNIALVLLAARKPDDASVLLREITEGVRVVEGPAMIASQLGNLAIGLAASRDTTGARAALREAMALDTAQFEQPPGGRGAAGAGDRRRARRSTRLVRPRSGAQRLPRRPDSTTSSALSWRSTSPTS